MTTSIPDTINTPVFTQLKDGARTAINKSRKVLVIVVREVGSDSISITLAKVVRRGLELLAVFAPLTPIVGPAIPVFKSITDVFKILGIFKNGQDLLNAGKIREVVKSVLGIGIAALSLVKLFDSFGWVNLAAISASFGRVAIIGAVAIIPLSIFISWLEGLKAGVEISLSVSKLINLAKKVAHVNEKKRFWATPLNFEKCDQRVRKYSVESQKLKQTLAELNTKKENAQENVDKLKVDQVPIDEKREKLKSQNKVKRIFANMKYKIRPPKVTRQLRKWQKLNTKIDNALEVANERKKTLKEKKVTWQRMGKRYTNIHPSNAARYTEDRTTIDAMRQLKFKKWTMKKSNVRFEQMKELLSMVVNGGVILLAVGSTALFFVGVFTTPVGGVILPVLIPALGFAIAVFGLGMFFIKRYKGKKINPVKLPKLADAKAWKARRKEKKSKAEIYQEDVKKEGDEPALKIRRKNQEAA